MDSIVIRHSKNKRIIVTLLPAICLLCMYLCAVISTYYFEYGSAGDRIMGYICVSLSVPMVVSIPFIFKVHREKILFDGCTFSVTPFIGKTKTIPLQDVKICTINRLNRITLFDDQSNRICRYYGAEDEENVILRALQRAETCVFTFRTRRDRQIVAKGRDDIFMLYLSSGKIMAVDDADMGWYGYRDASFAKGEIDVNIQSRLRKNNMHLAVWQFICVVLYFLGMILMANHVQGKVLSSLAMILFFGGMIVLLPIDYYYHRKEFAILKPTYYQVTATAVDEKNLSSRSKYSDRHFIYEFEDEHGVKRHRPSERVNAADMPWGTGIGEKRVFWYSPYAQYLLETEPLKYRGIRKRRHLSLQAWVKRHSALIVSGIAILIGIGFAAFQFAEKQMYIYSSDGRALQKEWNVKDNTTAAAAVEATGMEKEELEVWLKQSFYPYFYANNAGGAEFESFNVEEYKDILDEDTIRNIKENLSNSWGITDRESLIRKTDSLLEKGDKYTYIRTLEKMGKDSMNLSENEIFYTYKIHDPDEIYRYFGTYYAYNKIGEAGVDAWDYCRCIRLFAFGYLCGYISYDEYLIHAAPIAVYLQNEYDSWTQMYQSYYYGHLIFLGRNEYSNVNAKYGGYADYEKMGESAEIPFKNTSL